MHFTTLLGLSTISLANAQIFPSQSYKTENFTAPDLAITKHGATAPGYLFIGPSGNGTSSPAPLIMTDSNDLVWRGPNISTLDSQNFRVQTNSDKKIISYWTGFGSTKATFGHGLGQVNILDNTYKQIYTICPQLDLFYVNFTTMPCMVDNHESYLTDHNSIVVTAFNVTEYDLTPVGGSKKGYIFDALFYDIDLDTQEVLFRWSALEHTKKLPLTDSNYPLTVANVTYGSSPALPWDYFHINSVQPLKGGGYVVNSRYYWTTFQVLPNGNVGWRLEGSNGRDFTLAPGIFFSFEHMARIRSFQNGISTLTLFNNDNGGPLNGTNSTSGLELSINFRTMHVTQLRKLMDPSDPVFAAAQGAYVVLPNDHVLLGYGNVPKIKEFDANGNVVLAVQFGYLSPPSISPVTGYRSFKGEWHATPYYDPKVAASNVKAGTRVYMSWNGATDYDAWTIYGGQTMKRLKKVGTVARNGFETRFLANQTLSFVVAEAMEAGKGVRNATVTAVQ